MSDDKDEPQNRAEASNYREIRQAVSVEEKIYEAGLENIRFRVESHQILKRESNSTLSLMLGGSLAALGYFAHLMETDGSYMMSGAILFTSGWLLYLCGLTIRKCLGTDEVHVPTNTPKNLSAGKAQTWDDKLKPELENLQNRIQDYVELNRNLGNELNEIRKKVLFSPLAFLFGAAAGLAIDACVAP